MSLRFLIKTCTPDCFFFSGLRSYRQDLPFSFKLKVYDNANSKHLLFSFWNVLTQIHPSNTYLLRIPFWCTHRKIFGQGKQGQDKNKGPGKTKGWRQTSDQDEESCETSSAHKWRVAGTLSSSLAPFLRTSQRYTRTFISPAFHVDQLCICECGWLGVSGLWIPML